MDQTIAVVVPIRLNDVVYRLLAMLHVPVLSRNQYGYIDAEHTTAVIS